MLSVDWVIFAAKIFILLFVVYILMSAYRLIYQPWKIRNKYKQYANVAMNKTFNLISGDLTDIMKNESQNKNRMQNYIELALQNKELDFYVTQFGPWTIFDVLSAQALNEMERLIPSKIDRHDHQGGFPIGNITRGSLVLDETTQDLIERK